MHEAGSSAQSGADHSGDGVANSRADGHRDGVADNVANSAPEASRHPQHGESSFSARRVPVFDTPQAGVMPLVPAQRGIRDAARGEVLLRHARLASNGKPVFCTPSRAELDGMVAPRAGRGTDGKVIYSTREAAEAAGRELEALGARSLRAYRCSRSRRGHFHLTTDTTPRHHLRIPQQRLSA